MKKELYQPKAYAIIQHMQLVAHGLSPETELDYKFEYNTTAISSKHGETLSQVSV